MALFTPPLATVSVLCIDDWSFRRGRTFGTILVDLTTHTIIDLLADRNTETAAAWMRLHPEIEIVSRDRGEDYAFAARLGAPQARIVSRSCSCFVGEAGLKRTQRLKQHRQLTDAWAPKNG